MPFNFFENSVNNLLPSPSPDDWYRGIEQAFINAQWENTTTLRTIQEQDVNDNQYDYFENFTFTEVEAWVNSVVGQSSTGSKTGRDFVQLIFQNINHPKLEGRYYIVEGQYYLSYFDNRVVDLDANLSVRRCNEWMRIVDPMSGAIYQLPCVVDYDMSAPSNKVTNDIITPNNHAVVKVQQNAMSDRLFKTNKRFILGGRPFKITGMQNATNQFIDNSISSMMDIDLFLDEIWENDDLENGVADNGTYKYEININSSDLSLAQETKFDLTANVMLNGKEIGRVVEWNSLDETVITVDDSGQCTVVGQVGDSATIRASLYSNPDVFSDIIITVVEDSVITAEVDLQPDFTFIREYETKQIEVYGLYNGQQIVPDSVEVVLPNGTNGYLSYTIEDNVVTFECFKRYAGIVNIEFNIACLDPEFEASKTVPINLTSLLG